MLLHGFLHAFTGKTKYPLVKFKHIQPIWILMYILTTQGIAQAANIGEYKAVFSKPCTGIMTLSTPVPNLTQFTLCTYIKLDSSVPWTAFTYQLPSSSGNLYEIGLLGDSSSMKIWMFGTQITVLKSLNLHTWYEMCIKWSAKTENMAFYIDGTLEEEYKLENYTKLQGGGKVVLGCSSFVEANSTISVGLVGELYMFRMWRIDDVNFFQDCNDGNVIKWDIADWIYNPDVVQQDSTMHCAKRQPGNPITSEISNKIHRFHKRAANGLGLGLGLAFPSVSSPPVQSAYSSATVSELSNTSTSDILWTSTSSRTTSGIVSDVFNSSTTPVNEYIPTDYKKTTSVSEEFNSSITTVSAYVTTDNKNTTTGNMTCVYNASTEVQNLYADICSSKFPCNGTVHEIILQGNCTDLPNNFSGSSDYQINIKYLPNRCRILINDRNIICKVESLFPQYNLSMEANNTIDYCCCDEECRQSNCFQNHTLTCEGSSTGITKGQTTSYSNSIFTSNKNINNGSGTNYSDITSGFSTTSDINNGSSTTFNGITNGFSTTSDINNGSGTTSKDITNRFITTSDINNGSGTTSKDITNRFLTTSDINNGSGTTSKDITNGFITTSDINNGSGTTFNGIINGLITTSDINNGSGTNYSGITSGFSTTSDINNRSSTIFNGINNGSGTTSKDITNGFSTTSYINNGSSTTSKDITNGLITTSDINNGSSTNYNDITGGFSTTSDFNNGSGTTFNGINNGSGTTFNNLTVTTVNSQPISAIKNLTNTTWQTESHSLTSTDSNTMINSGTSLIINSSSSKTTINSGSTISFSRKSSTTVKRMPTTSHSSESSTSHRRTDFITLDTTFPEFSTSSSTSNQSAVIDRKVSYLEDLLTGEVNVTVAEEMVGILNTLLNTSQDLIASVSKRLIKVVDKMGLKLNFPEQSVNLTSQYLALAVNKVNANYFTETSFSVESSSGLKVTFDSQLPENSTGSVVLPASLLNDLSSVDKDIASRVQFNYFAKTSFFVDTSLTEKRYLVSNVISSSVANLTVTNLKQNVTVTLKTSPHNESGVLQCVFWDFTKNSGNGGWSTEGCTVNSATQNNNNNQTVCKCNHLTSFGILLDMTPNNQISPEDKLIMTFITYIGCGLSAIFLSVTLVTYIAFEKIRRDYPSKILIQLCAALIGLNLTFLMDPWIALYSEIPGLCISVAAFLHYFLLVSITWMGLEAFHMYLSLVKVFNTYVRKYILKFCIIGWGAPAVVVAIILAINKDLYELQMSEPYPNGAADYFCWMKPTIYWITVVGYFCTIFLLNVSMFVVVLIQLCRIKKQKQLGYQRKTFLQDIRSVAGITFLLGITWGLGFFSFGPGKTVIQYLFAIFNSLQGFFIFLFYCVAKENVRKQWRRYLCCGKFRLAENSDWSKTATNKLKNQTSKQGVSSSSSNSIQSTSNTNSTTLLVSNEHSMHPNGNDNVFKERNGVTFLSQNGEVQLHEFPGRPPVRNGDAQRTHLRRTSNRGSVHFVDQI